MSTSRQGRDSARDDVLVLAPLFEPAVLGGGPISTLKALLSAAPEDLSITLLTSNRDLDGSALHIEPQMGRYGHVRVERSDPAGLVGHLRAIARSIRRRPRYLYINGFFDPRFAIAPQLVNAVTKRRPRLIAPRGEMSPQALDISSGRKRLFISAYRLSMLDRGVVWHASSEREAADIRAVWGSSARVIVRENETSLPSVAEPPRQREGTLRISFVGRLVPNKGLHVLLEALQTVRAPVELLVGGPAEDERYAQRCRSMIAELPGRHVVKLHGLVRPDAVRAFVRSTDVFALPTETENFGHVIAEALSTSRPVLVPDTTPWTPVIRGGGGSVVASRNAADWAAAIERFAAMSPHLRFEACERAMEAYNGWMSARKGDHVFTTAALLDGFAGSPL